VGEGPLLAGVCYANLHLSMQQLRGVIFKGSGFYSTDNRSSSLSAPPATDTKDTDKKKPETPKSNSDNSEKRDKNSTSKSKD
jgi:hypothetical protein